MYGDRSAFSEGSILTGTAVSVVWLASFAWTACARCWGFRFATGAGSYTPRRSQTRSCPSRPSSSDCSSSTCRRLRSSGTSTSAMRRFAGREDRSRSARGLSQLCVARLRARCRVERAGRSERAGQVEPARGARDARHGQVVPRAPRARADPRGRRARRGRRRSARRGGRSGCAARSRRRRLAHARRSRSTAAASASRGFSGGRASSRSSPPICSS